MVVQKAVLSIDSLCKSAQPSLHAGDKELALMRDDAMLINCARGPVLDKQVCVYVCMYVFPCARACVCLCVCTSCGLRELK